MTTAIQNPLINKLSSINPVTFLKKQAVRSLNIPNNADIDDNDEAHDGDVSENHTQPPHITVFQQLNYEDQQKHNKICLKIQAYYDHFQKHFDNEIDIEKLKENTILEIEHKLIEVQHLVGSKNTAKALKRALGEGFQILEGQITMRTGVDVTSNYKRLKDDEDFNDVITELILEYSDDVYVKPIWRLLTIYSTSLKGTYDYNKLLKECSTLLDGEIPESLLEEINNT